MSHTVKHDLTSDTCECDTYLYQNFVSYDRRYSVQSALFVVTAVHWFQARGGVDPIHNGVDGIDSGDNGRQAVSPESSPNHAGGDTTPNPLEYA